MKKRIVSLLLGVCMVATMFVGCGSSGSTSTDTEQKTESSSNEQGTEQSTEMEITSFKYHAIDHQIPTTAGQSTDVQHLIYQYVTGGDKYGNHIPAFANYLTSESATEGKEALKKLNELYNAVFPDYRNGELIVDRLAFSISYDGENYQLINQDDEYEAKEGVTTAILFNVTLNPSETSKNTKPFSANVIVVLRKDINGLYYEWESIEGMYSLDSASKYFPDLNLE